MIVKGSTTIVNFYVTDNDGLPATGQASNISASISIDGGSASTISATISEKDSVNLPGWYEFEYAFSTAGNAFITFSCSGCVIMPWEEQIVEISSSSAPSASDVATAVWNYSSGRTVTNTIPNTSDIATSVWNYNLESNIVNPDKITGDLLSAIPSSNDIGSLVWGSAFMYDAAFLDEEPNELIVDRIWGYSSGGATYTVYSLLSGVPTVNSIASGVWGYNISTAAPPVAASTYLRSTYGLPSRVWSYSWSVNNTFISAYSYLTSIYNNTSSIDIPTPPSAGAIAASVWVHTSRSVTTTLVDDGAQAGSETYIATGSNVSGIPSSVWTYNIGPNTTTASTYLGSIGSIPSNVWTYKSGETETSSDRSLTYYPAFPTVPTVASIWDYSVNNVSMKSYMISTDSIAANVWTQTSRSLTTSLINDGSTTSHYFATIDDIPYAYSIAESVWDYSVAQVNADPISMYSYLISTYKNTSSISIPTVPTALEIAESVWTYSTTGNPSSDRSLTYYPAVSIPAYPDPDIIADAVWSHSLRIGPIEQLTYANMDSIVCSIYNNTSSISIPTVPTAGDIATSVWGYTIGDPAVSASTYLGTISTSMTSIASSVDYNKAALLNWSLSTASVLALHVGSTTTTYSISRDLAGNITGVSPN